MRAVATAFTGLLLGATSSAARAWATISAAASAATTFRDFIRPPLSFDATVWRPGCSPNSGWRPLAPGSPAIERAARRTRSPEHYGARRHDHAPFALPADERFFSGADGDSLLNRRSVKPARPPA